MNNDISKKLNELKTEDYVWILYIGIIFLSWYANSFERKYFINNDLKSKEKYQEITIVIFTILTIVYAYFFKGSLDEVKEIKIYDSNKKKDLTKLSLIASLLILISGFIYLYIAIKDDNLDVELVFN